MSAFEQSLGAALGPLRQQPVRIQSARIGRRRSNQKNALNKTTSQETKKAK
jgi:hypothetical protein